MFAVFLSFALVVAVAGQQTYRHARASVEQDAQDDLAVIADLKINQIVSWREERLADARTCSHSPANTQLVRPFFQGTATPGQIDTVLAWMEALRSAYKYPEVVLIDREGKVRLSVGDAPHVDAEDAANVALVLSSGKPLLSDFHRSEVTGRVHLGLYAPLLAPSETRAVPELIGVMLLEIDPSVFLQPLVQLWPRTSLTGETLLVRRDGNDVLVLSEARNAKGSSMTTRFPLGTPRLAAAMAARDEFGLVYGVDYRGVPVLAALRAVPDSAWRMVAKEDQDEALAQLHTLALLIGLASAGAIVLLGLAVLALWNRKHSDTLRLQLELEQREGRLAERYRLLLESTDQGIYGMDGEGRCTFINASALAMLGYTSEEVVGRDMHSMIHHSRPDASAYPVEDCPIYRAARQGRGVRVDAESFWRKDGTSFPVEYSSHPMKEEGGQRGAVIAFADITHRKQTEQELRKLSRAIESSAVTVVITDASGNIEFANPAFTATTGYTASEAKGKNPRLLSSGLQPPELYKGLWSTLVGGGVWEGEFCNRKKGGELFWEHATISSITDEFGRIANYVAVKQDITGAKEAQAQLRAATLAAEELNLHLETRIAERTRALAAALVEAQAATDAKSQFLACMSHELRTPLNAVLGMSELLTDTPLGPEQRGYAENIRVGGEMLLGVIGDILDFSKLDAGQQQLEHVEFDLELLLEDCAQLLAPRAREKGLELLVSVEPGTPTSLMGDVARLQRLVTNFLSNAVKFTTHGHVALRARLLAQASDRATLRIEVQDTGIGVAPEVQPRLFQAFTQANASTTRRFGGTGLGLAICRKVAELMDGSVGVESEEGQGATFWAAVPLTVVPRREPERQAGWKPRTLYVDATGTDRQAVLRQLRELALPCASLVGSDEALAVLRREAAAGTPYQLVVLDAIRPGPRERALVGALRAEPALSATPVMLVTAFEPPPATTGEQPFDATLLKPFRRATLAEALHRLSGAAQPQARGVDAAPRSRGSTSLALNGSPLVPSPSRDPDSTDLRPRGVDLGSKATVAPTRRAGRLLVVDDVAVNRTLAVALLRKLGHDAEPAANGVAALEAVRSRPFDLVFMDCQMPEMDGYEATRRIRALPVPLCDLPVVALTANAVSGDREKCLAAGMNDYLSKPVTSAAMQAALNRWIAAQ